MLRKQFARLSILLRAAIYHPNTSKPYSLLSRELHLSCTRLTVGDCGHPLLGHWPWPPFRGLSCWTHARRIAAASKPEGQASRSAVTR
jgi:hypothetical protein